MENGIRETHQDETSRSTFHGGAELTLVSQEHLGERRHSDQEVQHGAAVGVMRAVVVRLDGGHGVIFSNALFVLFLQILHDKHADVEVILL